MLPTKAPEKLESSVTLPANRQPVTIVFGPLKVIAEPRFAHTDPVMRVIVQELFVTILRNAEFDM
jgi:hypothetical protein